MLCKCKLGISSVINEAGLLVFVCLANTDIYFEALTLVGLNASIAALTLLLQMYLTEKLIQMLD